MDKPNLHGANNMKILRFTASWCESCKSMAKALDEVDTDVNIETVDIDTNPDLAVFYKVRSIPTLIFIKDDKELKRIVGVKRTSELKDWILSDQ